MVNIIIPVYNNKEQLREALFSVANQTKRTIVTTIVDDCSTEDLSEVIDFFSGFLNIKYIRLDKNIGPGGARQIGIDNVNAQFFDYIMFLDSDDKLYPKAVESLYRVAKSSNADFVVSNIEQERKGGNKEILTGENNLTWLHGKMYRYNFLKENNICFYNEIKWNEDSTFNLECRHTTKKIALLDEITYLWREANSSVTRDKEDKFGYNKNGVEHYILGQCYAILRVLENNNLSIKDKETIGLSLSSIYHNFQSLKQDKEEVYIRTKNKIEEVLNNKIFIEYFNNKIFLKKFCMKLQAVKIDREETVIYSETILQWLDRYDNKEIKKLLEGKE